MDSALEQSRGEINRPEFPAEKISEIHVKFTIQLVGMDLKGPSPGLSCPSQIHIFGRFFRL